LCSEGVIEIRSSFDINEKYDVILLPKNEDISAFKYCYLIYSDGYVWAFTYLNTHVYKINAETRDVIKVYNHELPTWFVKKHEDNIFFGGQYKLTKIAAGTDEVTDLKLPSISYEDYCFFKEDVDILGEIEKGNSLVETRYINIESLINAKLPAHAEKDTGEKSGAAGEIIFNFVKDHIK
jgi:hypothetical protein